MHLPYFSGDMHAVAACTHVQYRNLCGDKNSYQYFTMFVQYINVFSVRSKKIKIKKKNCCEDQIKSHF